MTYDIILISSPNKNIDYPGLSLPILTAALRQNGFKVRQYDLNIILRNELLTEEALKLILTDSLPIYAKFLSHSNIDLKKLCDISLYLDNLNNIYGFKSLEQVKKKAQQRDYAWIFNEDIRFQQLISLFKINRALHHLIDLALIISNFSVDDFLTSKISKFIDKYVKDLLNNNPEVIGFSILEIQRAFSLKIIRVLRGKQYNGKIVVGGADPTRFPLGYMKYINSIDVLFYREAELSLVRYLNQLHNNKPNYHDVPGLYFRKHNGEVISCNHDQLDLSFIPTPDFDDLPLDLYLTPTLPVQSSRGCYWHKCKFCIHWDTYSDFRTRSPEKFVDDIKHLSKKYKTKYFHFTDDCLTIPHARKIVKLIKENHLDIRWLSYFRIENDLDFNLLKEIWDAGGRILEMGLESASPRMLKLMNKNISPEVARRIADDASLIGLMVKFFMFHGYPKEELSEVKTTVEFTESLIKSGKIRPFLALRNRFELLHGSDIYLTVVKNKESAVLKYWKPSGVFGIRAEYMLKSDEESSRQVIKEFVNRIRKYMSDNKIFNTDDDNVMLDLLVLDNQPLKSGWRSF